MNLAQNGPNGKLPGASSHPHRVGSARPMGSLVPVNHFANKLQRASMLQDGISLHWHLVQFCAIFILPANAVPEFKTSASGMWDLMDCHRSPSMHIKRSQAASVCHKSSKKHYREQCPEWKRCLHWPAGTMSRRTDLKKLLSFPDILSPCVSQRRLIRCFGPFALRGSEKDCKSLNQTSSFAQFEALQHFQKNDSPNFGIGGWGIEFGRWPTKHWKVWLQFPLLGVNWRFTSVDQPCKDWGSVPGRRKDPAPDP